MYQLVRRLSSSAVPVVSDFSFLLLYLGDSWCGELGVGSEELELKQGLLRVQIFYIHEGKSFYFFITIIFFTSSSLSQYKMLALSLLFGNSYNINCGR